jgi:D-alanyl-D-alanine carboxypeptidase
VSCFKDPDTGRKLIICTLDDWEQYGDHIRLADYGFQRFPLRSLCEKGRVMSTLTDPATGETFALETAKGFSYPLSKEDTRRVQVRMTLPNRTEELRDGEEAGVVKFYLKGHRIGKVKLVCAAQSSGSDAA